MAIKLLEIKRGFVASLFFGFCRGDLNWHRICLIIGNVKFFEETEMTETRTQWMSGDYAAGMAVLLFLSPSSTPPMFNLEFNIIINKTWHAICRKLDVSKILDWLVK
jgi:hypothetical protein